MTPKNTNSLAERPFRLAPRTQVLFPKRFGVLLIACFFPFIHLSAQEKGIQPDTASHRGYLSVETAPPYWVLTLRNGFAFAAAVNYKLKQNPNIRLGLLGYSGRWSGQAVKDFLLTDDFGGDGWEAQWNGLGIETHYIFRLGLKRGGLLTGLRTQWNNITYRRNDQKKGTANHLMLTPQVGFQWFPVKKLGLYVLPWVGNQTDVLGTDKLKIDEVETSTRKNNPIVTFQVGWEFKL